MAVYIYDLTVTEVADYIGQLSTISTSTSPTATAVGRWLNAYAGRIAGILRAKGDAPENYQSTSTGRGLEVYNTIREHIAKRAAADWHIANRNGDTTLAERYITEWESYLGDLAADPGNTIGDESGITWRHNITPTNKRTTRTRSNAYN